MRSASTLREYKPPRFKFLCVDCKSHDIRYAHARRLDRILYHIGFRPLLCRRCLRRFYGHFPSGFSASSLLTIVMCGKNWNGKSDALKHKSSSTNQEDGLLISVDPDQGVHGPIREGVFDL